MSRKDSYIEHLLHIKQALQENRLAIFIGAGFSKAVNDDYPSWGKIIEKLKEAMPNNPTTDFLQIAEHYKLEFGFIATKEKIKSCFPLKDNPSDLHKKLIELYPHYIITTNWDNILETSLEETNLFYDIIAEDKDLPMSVLNYKIIKMHGDFTHNNYVFTESDYLNYSQNFPLIEAYLKGIFTTHIILFLGYSFGDIDLKLILKWLQNNSENNRARYMLIPDDNYNEYSQTYFSHYGITLLPIENNNGNHFSKDDYEKFLNQLEQDNYELEFTNPENYIYNQLKPLENLKLISSFQISQALTNCNILISNQKFLLQFYDQILTTDYNEKKRELYKKFYFDLKEKESPLSITQQKIITILQKAFICGIFFGDEFNPVDPFLFSNKYKYISDNLTKLLSFNYNVNEQIFPNNKIQKLLHEMICFYNLSKYEKAFDCCEKLMKLSFISKQYEYYFISLWNYNAILFELKHNYIPVEVLHEQKLTWKNPYQKYEDKDIEKIYNRMSYPIRIQCKYIYRSLTWDCLNSILIETQNTLTDIKTKLSEINNGRLFFTNKIPIDFYFHQNLICFIFENGILMEKAKPFKDICKNYLQIGLLRKKNNNHGEIILSIIEIYSAIKYFPTKELQNFFKNLSTKNTKILTTEENINKLINDIFNNCLTIYTTTHSQDYTTYVCNILFLLNHFQLTNIDFKIIIDKINSAISSANNHSYFFDAINNFIIAQYNLYIQKSEFPTVEVFNILSELLYKFVYNKTNIYEDNVIKTNSLNSIFYISSQTSYKFTDKNLLTLLNDKIKNHNIRKNVYIITSVFSNLYVISNEECQGFIRNYIEQNNKSLINEQLDLDIIFCELLLVNIKLYEFFEDRINQYINYFEQYTKGFYDSRIDTIYCLLEELIGNNNQLVLQNQFDKLYDLVVEIKERHNEDIKNIISTI